MPDVNWTALVVFVAAVRLHHLARLRRRALAPGRSRPAARMGPRRPALRHRRHLVPGRRRRLHRLHLHRRAGARLRRRRGRRSSRCPTPSSSIRCCFWCSRGSGTCATSTATSRRPISCAAASATAGWRSRSRSPASSRRMPYIALQLVGIQVVIGALGVTGHRLRGRSAAHHRLRRARRVHLFERPARAGLDRHRQGHPDLHRRPSPSIIVVPIKLGGFGKIFAAVPPAEAAARGAGRAHHRRLRRLCHAALGSALALFLYPHSHDRHPEREQRPGHPPQRRHPAGLLVHARACSR